MRALRFLPVVLALCVLLGAWGAGRMHAPLRKLREQYHLRSSDPLENAPPWINFAQVALGGFRGLVADLLWLRALRMQEEGRLFELVQLATWITHLEPRFPDAWAFHAWNLAYNISVMFTSPADRWRWVRHGISLLRDDALRLNPGEARLYRELAWLFEHKIGAEMDAAHRFYKRAWADEMAALFDGPRPPYDSLSDDLRKTLLSRYRLDPDVMRETEGRFGPLDWRLPYAHAIYWAWLGKQRAHGFEAIACERTIRHCLLEAYRQGRLVRDPGHAWFVLLPDLDLLPRVRTVYEELLTERPNDVELTSAYSAFLEEAVVLMFAHGRSEEARALFEELSRRFPSADRPKDFESFLYAAYTIAAETAEDLEFLLVSALARAQILRELNEPAAATGYEALARLCYERSDQHELPAWNELEERAREQVLREKDAAR